MQHNATAMAAMAIPRPTPILGDTIDVPELSDIEYLNDVLGLPTHKSETHFDDELDAKATSLGVPVSCQLRSDKRNTSSAESSSTVATTYHTRTFSTTSHNSASTALTAHSSIFAPPRQKVASQKHVNADPKTKGLNFAHYDKILLRLSPKPDKFKYLRPATPPASVAAPSLFSVRTKKSFLSVKSGLKKRMRWGKKVPEQFEPLGSCICCLAEADQDVLLQTLTCGHSQCADCLQALLKQAISDEAKMPPRCCNEPLPGYTIKSVLDLDSQQAFLKAVVQFNTPWEARVFCPNTDCQEFVPSSKPDSKSPLRNCCRSCHTEVCIRCRKEAHPFATDCPEDWAHEEISKTAKGSGWRSCYKCRSFVASGQGNIHMICKCEAEFCYVCGGIWDRSFGCPNMCEDVDLKKRQVEQEEKWAELEADRVVREIHEARAEEERKESESRSTAHPRFQSLKHHQILEQQRFSKFSARARQAMDARHVEFKASTIERHQEFLEKMRERHARTAVQLEDRQVAAEMELRTTLEQSERSIKVRLKHMEAYCDGLGRPSDSQMPRRTVTERDLRELGQQYNVRDNMERLTNSKINVMRVRQAKQMEDLLSRQELELNKLAAKKESEFEDISIRFAHEEDALIEIFKARQNRLQRRWELAIAILAKELEAEEKIKFGLVPPPLWPMNVEISETSPAEGTPRSLEASLLLSQLDSLPTFIATLDDITS